ncbi:RNA exonuclease 4 [Cynara cardunculus var. scolymus]|uniref:RNA exonuclease 4 n=1 Tax=Cynara cardunculus var. scolymus TaxID=59895 RepID=UPI000D629682|nr:RNA exonuclease 4 [Cynara cardunculus var. scolymus]
MGRSPGNGGPSFRFNQAEIETSEASHLKNSRLKNLKQLNPNWAQLCQKLGYGSELSSKKSGKEIQETILGKRKERSDKDEANENEMNALTPTSSDSSITDAIAMDCEMVGVSPLGNKSALGRVTLVNTWGNVIYDEHVRPVEHVVDFRTKISGIRPRDLKKAKDFRVVQKEVAELLKGKILVGHALRNDLKALLLSHPKKDIRDTAEYQPFLKEGRSKALRHLAAEVLSVKIQSGEHCPIEDARAAMMLYMKKKREWEKNVKDIVKMKLKQKKRKPKKRKKEGSLAS